MEYMVLISVIIGFILGRWQGTPNELIDQAKEKADSSIGRIRTVKLKKSGSGGKVEEDFNIYD